VAQSFTPSVATAGPSTLGTPSAHVKVTTKTCGSVQQ
jgi:hypothetical protein